MTQGSQTKGLKQLKQSELNKFDPFVSGKTNLMTQNFSNSLSSIHPRYNKTNTYYFELNKSFKYLWIIFY